MNPLIFPSERFTLETLMVELGGQSYRVVYRKYQHLPYVAKPVDAEYQSLDVLVPVSVNDRPVDASGAPILFNITIGGYMSASNFHENHGPVRRPAPLPPSSARRPGAGPHQVIVGMRTLRLQMALASGYVVVTPGARGRDNQSPDGSFPGKAPATIVDLKAAIRYLRHNADRMPGNPDWIVTSGCSAGGALSALLGTSGDSPLFTPYLEEIGAAEASDHVFATACYSPITDLEHADMSYEWFYGVQESMRGPVDATLSAKLAALHGPYQDSLGLKGRDGFGDVTEARLEEYLLRFLRPSAEAFLQRLDEDARRVYLAGHPWLGWDGRTAGFTLRSLARDVGRGKSAPAFDDLEMLSPEVSLFGNAHIDFRHYTDFSLQHATGNPDERIDDELAACVRMMNAMHFARQGKTAHAHHWWLRTGARERGISPSVMVNLGTCLENHGHNVDMAFFWDGGHCADEDPEGMIAWIGRVTGYGDTV